MNDHFQRECRIEIPQRGYGRVDSILFQDESDYVTLVIDLIGADWLDNHKKNFSKLLSNKINPLNDAPLFRLEVNLSATGPWFGENIQSGKRVKLPKRLLSKTEGRWVELQLEEVVGIGESNALIYKSLYSAPLPVISTGTFVSSTKAKELSKTFSLKNLPKIDENEIIKYVEMVNAEYLAVYDVGQGNANALLNEYLIPEMYFDLGAAVYGNQKTAPKNLVFCFTNNPAIILSHWDADHWAGTYATMVGKTYPAMNRTWIAPLQKVGAIQLAFAWDVITNGGAFLIYAPSPGSVNSFALSTTRIMKVGIGAGSDRNNTGIVVTVENEIQPQNFRSWLLTGDCEYKYFYTRFCLAPPIGIVAPHHGAKLHGGSVAPQPIKTDVYKRLVYSFGPNNRHGCTGVRHPTLEGINAHTGWDHGKWGSVSIGDVQPGGDVIATSEHSSTSRGSVLVGWGPIKWSGPIIPPCVKTGHINTCSSLFNYF
ncbi:MULTISPECIES: hypothetical protein [Enterobacter cloacae complex]|jgi:hypothetical protein|uniref:Uncharacterized protein n=1 Tax=Enterobacter cloacae TaxID=550 RepID=A0AAW6RYM1_ENTCL|nr:hypothetical protein [Enterobacter cloacae]EGQ5294585.1 hypothetical protein [Enterobacter cloacae]EKX4007334.1 hypothetical protein [Enterobacter cloacae]EKX4080963.1 hypothetical protein [Enterobacter cloacae]ELE9039439.1 hypothetical protein [Enterobacter cloacae]ELG6440809.1 hypothetical protein [Enterobacter cloacae]